uniref:Uncharacterized protein n=1 Tax=Hemiselmis tepida TaxID=464990 RepID=A0A7S0W0S1_9CRYP|mmetsp:Transcript_27194/g.69022  ORF Transcript_27194/g.69022 Transcript_27194/m.69022 type:complete len:139 (+) Transcript_27194:43-459(+)
MLRISLILCFVAQGSAFLGPTFGGEMMLREGRGSLAALQMGGKGFGSAPAPKKGDKGGKAPAVGDVDLGSLVADASGMKKMKKSQVVNRMEKKLAALDAMENDDGEEVDEEAYAKAVAEAQETTRRLGREALERGDKF